MPGRRALTRRSLLLTSLVAASFAAFFPAVWAGFLADDYTLLRVLRNLEGVGWVFERNDAGEAGDAGHFYRPVWLLWNAGLHTVFGERAAAFHLGNLALYGTITVEVWVLARRLAGESRAWVAAAAFALYPRHGESVSWITGNTDLTATVLALAALLCASARWRLSFRLVSAAGLSALAALAKESAFVLPLLAVLVLWALGPRRQRWLVPAAMGLVLLAVAVARYEVIGGVGGYTAYPWTVKRVFGVIASYVLAAVTPPDLALLRHEVFLLLPAAVLAGVAARFWVLRRRRDREAMRIAAIGLAWFLIAALPTLNIAVDLNNANGERLLFLGSVGLALSFAALVDVKGGRLRAAVLGGAALAGLVLALVSARDWVEAERISARVIASAASLAPPNGELVLLSSPESFRTAHIFPSPAAMDAALERAGRRDVTAAFCAPVIVREVNSGVLSITQLDTARYRAETTWQAPFDFPALRPPSPLSADCPYERGASGPPGLGLAAVVRPAPSKQPAVLAYFDGHSLRRCCG